MKVYDSIVSANTGAISGWREALFHLSRQIEQFFLSPSMLAAVKQNKRDFRENQLFNCIISAVLFAAINSKERYSKI